MITPQWIQNDDVRSFVPLEILKHLNKARSRKLTWALCCAFLPRAADEGLTMPLASIWNLSYIVLDIELLLAELRIALSSLVTARDGRRTSFIRD